MMGSIEQLRVDFRKQFQAAFLTLEQKTLSHYARLEAQEITTQERKCAAISLPLCVPIPSPR